VDNPEILIFFHVYKTVYQYITYIKIICGKLFLRKNIQHIIKSSHICTINYDLRMCVSFG